MNLYSDISEHLMAETPLPNLVYDQHGVLQGFNAAAQDLFQGSLSPGQLVRELFGKEPHQNAMDGQVLLVFPDGHRAHAKIRKLHTGKCAGWYSLWLDENQTVNRIEQLQSLVDLIPHIVHDLRNPLAGIQSLAELMAEETEPGQQLDDLQGILEEVRVLELHLERFRLAEPVDPRKGHLSDIATSLSDLADFFSARAKRLGVAFHFVQPASRQVRLNPKFLFRMVGNLLHTAIEAGGGGSLRLKLVSEDGWLWFEIMRCPVDQNNHGEAHNKTLKLIRHTITASGCRLETQRLDNGWCLRLGIQV